MTKLILLQTYFHKHEAEMAVGLLQDNGIEAILQSDDLAGMRQHLTLGAGNNRVLVKEEDYLKAKEILDTLNVDFSEEELKDIEEIAVSEKVEDLSPAPQVDSKKYVILIPVIIVGLFLFVYISRSRTPQNYFSHAPSRITCQHARSGADVYSVCKDYYKDLNVRWIGNLKNQRWNGIFQEFYPSGSLKLELNYQGNQLNGPFTDYYENKQVRAKGFYRNNQMAGEYQRFYKSGELMRTSDYVDDKIDGYLKTYSKSGKLVETLRYKNGVRYNDQGKPFEGKDELYYENGNLWEEWNYKKGRLEGEQKTYFENGRIDAHLFFKKGRLDGESLYYREDGSIQSIYHNRKGKVVSVKEYDWDGNIIFEE